MSIRGFPSASAMKGGGGDDVVLTNAVTKTTTTTTLGSSAPSGSSFGQAVTFTADGGANSDTGVPTGTVTFTIDGTAQSPVPFEVLGNVDQASLPAISSLTVGPHTIQATYSGDDNFATSMAKSLIQNVNPIATSTTLSSAAPSGSSFGQPVTFTANVAPGSGTATPTGTVTFTVDGRRRPRCRFRSLAALTRPACHRSHRCREARTRSRRPTAAITRSPRAQRRPNR